jgi:DNA-binding IclR family transcriptional regulator
MNRNQKLKVSKIIELVLGSVRPLTSQEISVALNLDTSTTNRLLNSMAADSLISKDKQTRTFYSSTSSLFPLPLNHPINTSAEKIWTVILSLRNEWSLTSGFVYFYDGKRVLASLAIGSDPLTSQYNTILRSPLHASGSGKLFLASIPERKWKHYLPTEPYEQFTKNTTISLRKLKLEIKNSLKIGGIICKDDYVDGFSVVSSPVFVNKKIIGCFFISGRSTHLAEKGFEKLMLSIKKQATLFELSNPSIINFENLYL